MQDLSKIRYAITYSDPKKWDKVIHYFVDGKTFCGMENDSFRHLPMTIVDSIPEDRRPCQTCVAARILREMKENTKSTKRLFSHRHILGENHEY